MFNRSGMCLIISAASPLSSQEISAPLTDLDLISSVLSRPDRRSTATGRATTSTPIMGVITESLGLSHRGSEQPRLVPSFEVYLSQTRPQGFRLTHLFVTLVRSNAQSSAVVCDGCVGTVIWRMGRAPCSYAAEPPEDLTIVEDSPGYRTPQGSWAGTGPGERWAPWTPWGWTPSPRRRLACGIPPWLCRHHP